MYVATRYLLLPLLLLCLMLFSSSHRLILQRIREYLTIREL